MLKVLGSGSALNGLGAVNAVNEWMNKGGLGHICAHIGNTGPGEPPEDDEMNEMTLPFRHRIRNSNAGGLRLSSLPLIPWGSPQNWIFMSEQRRNIFKTWMPERGSNLLHVMDRISCIDVRGQESCMGHTNRKKWIDNYFKAVLSVENLKRSHLQICIWKNALDQDPSNLVCTQYVWGKMPEHKINATNNSARKWWGGGGG